jgi:hypothetical protein
MSTMHARGKNGVADPFKGLRNIDPCVWDVFAAAIHQARTGESRDWWTFTPERKRRQALGEFPR